MGKSLLALPTHSGYCVEYYTGEERKLSNGRTIRLKSEFCNTSREKCELKKRELEKQGFEVIGICECIF